MELTSVTSRIVLLGVFDPDCVTTELGIVPSSIFRKGDFIICPPRKYKHDGWIIENKKIETVDIMDSVFPLLNKIHPYTNKLFLLKEKLQLSIELSITVYIENGQTPCMVFERDVMNIICALGAEIDIDLYCMSLQGEET